MMKTLIQAICPLVARPSLATAPAKKLQAMRRAGEISFLFALSFFFVLRPAGAQAPAANSQPAQTASISEFELRQQLVGKYLYLRGRYIASSLSFNEHGKLEGTSPQASYTLSVVRIETLNLSRHKLELKGVRFGLHFLGALSSQEPASTFDHVRLTPRKKWERITIARMKVIKPPKQRKGAPAPKPVPPQPDATTTTSASYADAVLRQAIGDVFASTLDTRMMAALPAYWRDFYQDESDKTPSDPLLPGVLLVSDVDRKPSLVGHLEAPSDQYAQDHGIAGLALYRTVVSADGTPQQVSIARPIGFGLDENAISAIKSARFEPGMKDGKPVPVLLDLVVEFRIYSKRTAAAATPADATAASAPAKAVLPGPYTAEKD
ncbi:MAG TPA: energy transducer TonB [Terracidiphilus sp.]|nr:energy transducer TonB [Terracidiphilus sp.]